MIVVDTSALVDFFRGVAAPHVDELERLERDAVPFWIPALCCQEVLQGARDEREWRLLDTYLQTQHVLTPEDPWLTHVAAARLYYECRRRGVTVRSTVDCIVAQLTIEAGARLLHADADFEHIASVHPLELWALSP